MNYEMDWIQFVFLVTQVGKPAAELMNGFVKSLKSSFDVIPAKAGIQCFQIVLDACLRRHDRVSDFLRGCQC